MGKIAILAIDDDELEHQVISRLLRDADSQESYETIPCTTLVAGVERLGREPAVDVVLLDLGLPESQGIDTVSEFGSHLNDYPVIILTGNTDQEVARRAIHMGAQDYLDKSALTSDSLARAIRHALERHALKRDVEQARYEREISFAEDVAVAAETPMASQLYGQRALRLSTPATFEQLIDAYCESLRDAVEQRAYRVEHRLNDRLKSMAGTLGRLLATPRDVVELHTEALRRQAEGIAPAKRRATVEESRMMLIEIIGELCSYYRRQAVGAPKLAQDDGRSAKR